MECKHEYTTAVAKPDLGYWYNVLVKAMSTVPLVIQMILAGHTNSESLLHTPPPPPVRVRENLEDRGAGSRALKQLKMARRIDFILFQGPLCTLRTDCQDCPVFLFGLE